MLIYTSVDKKGIIRKIVEQLERDLSLIVSAAITAREAATHEESKAEDKYDTRGLEASYLAGAQAKRAAELEQLIYNYRQLEVKNFDDETAIDVTALVELEAEEAAKKNWFFLVPKGIAMSVELDAQKVQVVTVASPLGEELLGRKKGDDFELSTPKQKIAYVITNVS